MSNQKANDDGDLTKFHRVRLRIVNRHASSNPRRGRIIRVKRRRMKDSVCDFCRQMKIPVYMKVVWHCVKYADSSSSANMVLSRRPTRLLLRVQAPLWQRPRLLTYETTYPTCTENMSLVSEIQEPPHFDYVVPQVCCIALENPDLVEIKVSYFKDIIRCFYQKICKRVAEFLNGMWAVRFTLDTEGANSRFFS